MEMFPAVVVYKNGHLYMDIAFKEWKVVMQEMVRFMKVDAAYLNTRPLRYCAMFDSYPSSLPYVARFHSTKVLKLRDALVMSYHRNEVKFSELTIDTFIILQCLEWEPSGSFYQKQPVESHDNGTSTDQSVTSGLIDINLVADMTDPYLPPNPKKVVLYRPSATQLLASLRVADGHLIMGHSLVIDESSMTGERKIVYKDQKAPFVMSDCKVSDGSGTMLVTSMGINTNWDC